MVAVIQRGLFIIFLGLCTPGLAQESNENVEKKSKFELLPRDVYFQPGAGVRVRYDNLQGATGGAFNEESESLVTHRAQFEMALYKGESFETHFRFINFANWGVSNTGNSNFGQRDSLNRDNSLLVNQAYAHWKISESMGMRFGRAPLHLGLGYTYGTNEWFDVPYSFDLFDVSWDWPLLTASFITARVLDMDKVEGETSVSDPDEDHFIFNFELKELAEIISLANFSLIQVNRESGSIDGGTSIINGLNMQRVAVDLGLEGRNFFAETFFTFVTGEERIAPANRVTTQERRQLSQMAYDIKLGYKLPETSNLRFWAGYHFDSGDDSPDGGDAKSFDSFYYEVYGQAGLMDLLRWGNLNFFRLGLDLDLATGLTLGAEYLSFNKSEAADDVRFGLAGRFLNNRIASGDIQLGQATDLGQELDVWLDWQFQSGVNIRTTVSAFVPGEVFNKATGADGLPTGTVVQFLSQVGFFF